MGRFRPRGSPVPVESVQRWECHCREPAVLLGTFDASGQINIKVRDRYWHIEGTVRTTCPRCGLEHELDLRRDPAPTASSAIAPAVSP